MEIVFDLEGSDEGCAFFALYAGLRMYKELKESQLKPEGAFSIAAAEAGCLLEQLKEQHPTEYWEAAAGFEHVYK